MKIYAYMNLTPTDVDASWFILAFPLGHALAINNQPLTLKLKKQLLLYWSNERLSVPVHCLWERNTYSSGSQHRKLETSRDICSAARARRVLDAPRDRVHRSPHPRLRGFPISREWRLFADSRQRLQKDMSSYSTLMM